MHRSSEHPSPDPAIASYYDETLKTRLKDFVDGNERIAAAIELVSSQVDRSATKILEIGCGLGISSSQLARGRDWLTIHAVDISPQSIAAANRLFGGDDRLIFEVSDLRDVPRMAPYDLITLLDVYEHIPRHSWPGFHAVLAESLADGGAIVATTPSPMHQDHLARDNRAGLQIVDETVRLDDFLSLAKDVGGEIAYFRYVSIWNTNDYMHVVIRKNIDYRPLRWTRPEGTMNRAVGWLSGRWSAATRRLAASRRRRWVLSRLGGAVEIKP
jgi:2-polyprenyl-3-methyl-5-hydroxy-6-metoxy-1,4-benzoquinol methylase